MEVFNISVNATCEAYSNLNQDEEIAYNRILCLLCKNGKLGAACYDFKEKIVSVYDEMADVAPQYLMTATLYREVSPKYILTFGNRTQNYVKTLIDLRNSETDTSIISSQQPENLFLVSLKDYSYDMCRSIVSKVILKTLHPNELEERSPKQELLMYSIINPNHKLSVQAFGALYKYLEKNWRSLEPQYGEFACWNVRQVSMNTHVLLDSGIFRALQIFAPRSHEAGFKRGDPSTNREGLSLYKLFSVHCKSKIGLQQLRNNLLTPINDTEELGKRLDFIKFLIEPPHSDFVKSLQDSIRHLSDVGNILVKIQNSRASSRDWNVLYTTIHHTICINEISGRYRRKIPLFAELNDAVTDNLLCLRESIHNALDFRVGPKRGRPVIKFGLDENLDAKFLRRQDIAKHVTTAASLAVQDLPDYINECKIIYLPEMGHLMALKEWELGCDPEQLQYLGFQFMFSLGGSIHYKNPLCVALALETPYSREELAKKYPGYGTKFIYFPDDDDNPMKVYLNVTDLRMAILGLGEYDVKRDVVLTYYSREFSSGIPITKILTLEYLLMRNKPVRFITHGWMSDGKKDMAINLTNGFLNKYDANVFVVDWSRISKNIFYPVPMLATWDVGNHLAKYLNYLTDVLNFDPGNIHMVGHSLGAHVSGFAARKAKASIGRVTGLDPALPGFSVGLVEGGTISASDAQFVDIIHTCAGFLGYKEPLGHVDFYPNGGTPPQPGCTILELVEACSHSKSWKIFASSLLNTEQHMAYRCTNLSDLSRGGCLGESIPLGDSTPSHSRGVYYAEVPEINL